MERLAHLIDADAFSLDARLLVALDRAGGECVVQRFTYWYTGRPPLYEAVVLGSRAPQR